MKIRILMLSLLGLIFFNSCSSDSDSSNPTTQNLDPDTILPRKVLYDNAFDELNSFEFFYNQNKIDYIVDKFIEGGTEIDYATFYFTYNGDLITEIKGIDTSGNVIYDMDLTYQNNNLIQKHILSMGNEDLIENIYDYSYNPDGSITMSHDNYNVNILINNGLVYRINDIGIYCGNTFSPFKNIVGLDKVFFEFDYINGDLDNRDNFGNLFISTKYNVINSTRGLYNYAFNEIEFPISIFVDDFDFFGLDSNYYIFYQ